MRVWCMILLVYSFVLCVAGLYVSGEVEACCWWPVIAVTHGSQWQASASTEACRTATHRTKR
jgi:hypothetical protein